jgi:hypothetical protein
VGDAVGDREGLLVVGEADGLLVVGDCDGDLDGDLEGLLLVGEVEGLLVVGDCDGDLDGDFDGDVVVGRDVGEAVGSVPSTHAHVRATFPAHVPAPPALSQPAEVMLDTASWLLTLGELVV